MAPPVDQVLTALRNSRRYGTLHEPLLRRLAIEALEIERGNVRHAVKRTKRRLHQIFGAYLPQRPRYGRLLEEIEAALATGNPETTKDALRHAMGEHASTRERLAILEVFYREVFARLGQVSSLLDVACGLNPLAVPWMDLAAGSRYVAIDIDTELVAFVGSCLGLLGVEHDVRVADLLTEEVELEPADVALLLKSVPCLDQQERNGGKRVIDQLPARRVVVSFPTRSIGGRAKGMRDTYAASFEATAHAEGWELDRLELPGELVYLVSREPARPPARRLSRSRP